MKGAKMQAIAIMAVTVLMGALAYGQSNPSVGLWKFEEPNKTTLIRTYQENGTLMGKVEKLIKNNVEDSAARCGKCQGDRKDKPIDGMVIIWDMKPDGDKWAGFYGNLGRNTVMAPGLTTFNFSLVKNFRFSENQNLAFRAEFFNLLNRANFGLPIKEVFNPTGRSGNAGNIRNVSTNAREIQFGLRYAF